MPAGFVKCVKGRGRVKRVSGPNKDHGLAAGEYVNYCFLKGKSYRGEVKQAEQSTGSAKRAYSRRRRQLAGGR